MLHARMSRTHPQALPLCSLHAMNTTRIALLTTLALTTLASTQCERAAAAKPAAAEQTPAQDKIQRGRHLVENVGLCADCHAARLPSGEFDRSRWLQGSTLPFKPLVEMPWNPVAPPIAGLPTLPNDEDAIKFFMTGARPSGAPVMPPMPAYRLTREEAEAMVAYLRSVKPGS